jgi:MSHA biogenesis protein MshO
MKQRGFTLVELIMVIVIMGIMASTIVVFLKPAVDSYFDSRRRADLTDIADTAIRRMTQDIRRAVPNSVRSVSPTCFQLVPTIAGGRYRMASDTVNDIPAPLPCAPGATCSAPLDTSQATTVFDVLTPLTTVPAQNDWIVVNNQNAGDVYAGSNRGQISAALTTPRATDGLHRIQIASTQFSNGYDGGRFVAVANAEQTVFYSCVNNTLYRTVALFGANQATTCAATTGAIVATDAASCNFVYDPNQGATQQSGFVWMQLQLTRSSESVVMTHGVHVSNAP